MNHKPYPERYAHHAHQAVDVNGSGRDFVCGDLHGCYSELMAKLDEVGFDDGKDRLFALGDLNDKGPDSMACLRLLKEPWFQSTLGNHEQMMMDALLYNDRVDYWLENGGAWYKSLSTSEQEELMALITDHIVDLPLAITLKTADGRIGLIHGDPPQDWSDIENDKADYVSSAWGRKRIQMQDDSIVRNIDRVYVGHSADTMVRQLGNVFFIDTGASYKGGKLTLIEVS